MTLNLEFKSALLANGWAENVSIEIDDAGVISDLRVRKTPSTAADKRCVIPGLANLHSHAHQRAMAGLAEQAGPTGDSFWTWRKIMYEFLDAMQPHHLRAIAAQLYLELVSSGYTHVAEFQYLHHQAGGNHYSNLAEMSLQTLNAAQEVGIGITSLPVHYQYSGFGGQSVSPQQLRFYNQPESILEIVNLVEQATADDTNSNVGIAGHSLRATDKTSFNTVLSGLTAKERPIHLHIAEQQQEVADCLAWSGARPVAYCLDNFSVDAHWCLIHATHMTDDETQRLAASGAVAGICPTTEANLGDGFFKANLYLDNGGKLGIGSDSHISTAAVEELRWLEYGQRLLHQSRNQLSGGPNRSTGRNLFEIAAAGGAQACGHSSGSIAIGKRADFLVLDTEHPLLIGRQQDELLDSWIFSGNNNPISEVFVGGEKVISDGQHAKQGEINQRFRTTMRELIETQ